MGDGAITPGLHILLLLVKLVTVAVENRIYTYTFFNSHGPKTLRGTGNNCDGESSVKGVIIQGVEAYLF